MLVEMVQLNTIPIGKHNQMRKPQRGEPFPIRWREYQDCYYEGEMVQDDNLVLITGNLPNTDMKVIAFDFDGRCSIQDYLTISGVMKELGLPTPYEVNYTANLGYHFIYITDQAREIRNKQKLSLKKGIFPDNIKMVDIRGDGGLLYYPPTKFVDGQQAYKHILRTPDDKDIDIVDSGLIVSILKEIYTEPMKGNKPRRKTDQTFSSLHLEKDAQNIQVLRQPLRELMMPGAYDIEELSIYTGIQEFLYWKALFLEVLWKNVDLDTVYRLLSEFQACFDLRETEHQLRYLDPSIRPFTNKKLMEMFPDWVRPKYKRKVRGFCD